MYSWVRTGVKQYDDAHCDIGTLELTLHQPVLERKKHTCKMTWRLQAFGS